MDIRALEQLCELARMQLSPDEIVEFEHKFNKLLGFVETVNSYKPRSEGSPLTLVDELKPRADKVREFEWPSDTKHDYRVPKIIDFEGEQP